MVIVKTIETNPSVSLNFFNLLFMHRILFFIGLKLIAIRSAITNGIAYFNPIASSIKSTVYISRNLDILLQLFINSGEKY